MSTNERLARVRAVLTLSGADIIVCPFIAKNEHGFTCSYCKRRSEGGEHYWVGVWPGSNTATRAVCPACLDRV